MTGVPCGDGRDPREGRARAGRGHDASALLGRAGAARASQARRRPVGRGEGPGLA